MPRIPEELSHLPPSAFRVRLGKEMRSEEGRVRDGSEESGDVDVGADVADAGINAGSLPSDATAGEAQVAAQSLNQIMFNLPDDDAVAKVLTLPEKRYEDLAKDTWEHFRQEVFQDHRWDNSLQFLRGLDDWGPERARAVLCVGAEAYGIWQLGQASLQGLADQLLGKPPAPSPAIIALTAMACSDGAQAPRSSSERARARQSGRRQVTMGNGDIEKYQRSKQRLRHCMEALRVKDSVFWAKAVLSALILAIAGLYAVKVVVHMYPGALRVFGWPVFFARMGGMAAVCWTAVLYWSMARGVLSKMYCINSGQGLLAATLDAHKDIHVLSGVLLLLSGIGHTFAHLLGTVPGILRHTAEEINDVLGCANADTTPGFMNVDLGGLQWPPCPVQELPKSVEGVLLQTMPGLTGILLLVLLAITAYTGHEKNRKSNFDIFWYVHNVSVICWPVLLFLHGSNGWIGTGFPLVVFAAGLPMAFYYMDRACRLLRFYLFGGKAVRIMKSIVRSGKDGASPDKGALTYLEISKPPALWHFRPGMYAFICMPEYAPLQWHPFTICSGKDDATVDFLIAAVGDWTRELAKRCLLAKEGQGKLPKVALDGPYMAPTQSALGKKVLIAVGAGVGITPFLSLMSTIISRLDSEGYKTSVEVHFYWMTRSADEFLFGRKHFARILRNANLKQKVFFHLHVTGKDPEKNPGAYAFREALRRQSKIDREAFAKVLGTTGHSLESLMGPLLPWCWADGAKEDVLWVNQLLHSKAIPDLSRCQKWRATTSKWSEDGGSTARSSKTAETELDKVELMVPIIFGRPDFATEIRSIGKARPGLDVHIYVCGNEQVVGNLRDVTSVCNQHAAADTASNGAPKQTYTLHFERFG